MHMNKQAYTQHALDRSTARNIPPGLIELILDYGEPLKARDGGVKLALSKASLRKLKHDYGRPFANALAGYRNVYVVMCDGRVITVARSKKPLIH